MSSINSRLKGFGFGKRKSTASIQTLENKTTTPTHTPPPLQHQQPPPPAQQVPHPQTGQQHPNPLLSNPLPPGIGVVGGGGPPVLPQIPQSAVGPIGFAGAPTPTPPPNQQAVFGPPGQYSQLMNQHPGPGGRPPSYASANFPPGPPGRTSPMGQGPPPPGPMNRPPPSQVLGGPPPLQTGPGITGYPPGPGGMPMGGPPQGGPPGPPGYGGPPAGYPPGPPPPQQGGAPMPPGPVAYGRNPTEVDGNSRSKAQLIVGIDFVSFSPSVHFALASIW